MMLIDNKHEIGDIVFLATDEEQLERFVTGLSIRPNSISYMLSCGSNESFHYDFEITSERNVLIGK